MTETLVRLLLQLSEAGDPAILWGRQAAIYAGREFKRLLGRGAALIKTRRSPTGYFLALAPEDFDLRQ